MSNPELLLAGSDPEAIDTLYGDDGTGYLKAAGDSEGVPTGASDPRAPHLVQLAKAGTGTLTNVSGSASSVTLLAANAARKGLTIWNDSAAILYVKCAAAAASATSCTVKLVADAYWELPFSYRGEIRGIWASATGAARLTEFS